MCDSQTENRKPIILVVDDEETILHILEIGLKQRDYIVLTASCGKEALAVADNKIFDYALVDIKLPDLNGIALVAEFKKRFPQVNHILMTGYPGIKSAVEALRYQVCDYLIKPFHIDQVCAIIERVEHERQLMAKHAEDNERIQMLQQENEKLKQQLEELVPEESRLKQMVLGKYNALKTDEENALHSYTQQQGMDHEKPPKPKEK